MRELNPRLRWATFAAVLTAALIVAGVVAYFAVPAQGGVHDITLRGVDDDDLAGWGRLLEPHGDSPSVSAADAIQSASSRKPDRRVLETVLVRLVGENASPRLDRLAWAVNFDPLTVDAAPIIGPIGAELPETCASHPEYAVAFIDAHTGDLIFEIQHVKDLEHVAEDAACPVDSNDHPAPTQVPGQ